MSVRHIFCRMNGLQRRIAMASSKGQQQPAPSEDQKSPATEPASSPTVMSAAAPAAPHPVDHAARAVMHPDRHDPDWRYYHGAMGG